jgi:hypothetical protein
MAEYNDSPRGDRLSRSENGSVFERPRRLQWPSRTVMVLVPLHLLAFLALYWGAMRIVRGEILRTHAQDARIMLHHEVEEFHPLMVSGPTEESYLHIDEFVRAHEVFQLNLYDVDGEPILGSAAPNPEVSRFLDTDRPEQYSWERREGRVEVSGIVRLTAEDRCVEK